MHGRREALQFRDPASERVRRNQGAEGQEFTSSALLSWVAVVGKMCAAFQEIATELLHISH